jgi:D-glycero-D-manno-heptose 1,7-bisphosphate phosphatase
MQIVIIQQEGVIGPKATGRETAGTPWAPFDGSLEAIARLNQSGYRVVVTSTGSPLGDGTLDIEAINGGLRRMHDALEGCGGHIVGFFFCPHDDSEACGCHSPEPGLLRQVADRFGVPLEGVAVIAHGLGNARCALAAGARPIRVASGDAEPAEPEIPRYPDLGAAVAALLDDAPCS